MAVALLRVAASLKKTKGRKPRHDHFITCAVNVFHDAGGRVAFSGNSPWERFLSKLWELLPTSRPKRASALIRRAERMELRKKFPWRQDHWIIFTAKAFHDAGGRVAFSGNSTFSGNSPWERLLRRVWEKMPPTARPETASALVRRAKQLSKKLPGCEADVHAFEEFISELKVHLRRGEVRG